jgi:hypothetical protein
MSLFATKSVSRILFVAPSAFLPLKVVGHMTSIGTLFAFV